MTTILHVEDDSTLAELVQHAFEAFGFHGTHLMANSVHEAQEILADVANYERIDLVISDMNLDDGTGLDVIRHVRSNPAREHVPILILSGDVDPANINRAYALGANAYVPKGAFARPITNVVRALYEHWLRDVRFPTAAPQGRTHMWIAQAVLLQARVAEHNLSSAARFGASDSSHASPWLQIALREGNLANLLAFLGSQIGNRELPSELLDEMEARQVEIARTVDLLEGTPARTHDEGLRHLLAAVSALDTAPFARGVSSLFPAAPVAVAALCEVAAAGLDELAAWIEANAIDRELRAHVPRLRAEAEELRSSTEAAALPTGVSADAQHSASDR